MSDETTRQTADDPAYVAAREIAMRSGGLAIVQNIGIIARAYQPTLDAVRQLLATIHRGAEHCAYVYPYGEQWAREGQRCMSSRDGWTHEANQCAFEHTFVAPSLIQSCADAAARVVAYDLLRDAGEKERADLWRQLHATQKVCANVHSRWGSEIAEASAWLPWQPQNAGIGQRAKFQAEQLDAARAEVRRLADKLSIAQLENLKGVSVLADVEKRNRRLSELLLAAVKSYVTVVPESALTCPVPDHGMPCGNPMPCAAHPTNDLRCAIFGCDRRIAGGGSTGGWVHVEARIIPYDHQAAPPLDVPRADPAEGVLCANANCGHEEAEHENTHPPPCLCCANGSFRSPVSNPNAAPGPVVCPLCPHSTPHDHEESDGNGGRYPPRCNDNECDCRRLYRDRALAAIEEAGKPWQRRAEQAALQLAAREREVTNLRAKLATRTDEADTAVKALGACREYHDAEVVDLRKQLAEVDAAINDAVYRAMEEHESAICPEDVGCAEYVAALKKQLSEARAPRPIDPQTRENIRKELATRTWMMNGCGTYDGLVDHVIEIVGHSAISVEDYQRELHGGHTLLGDGDCISRRPDDVKPGWMWCARRPMGCHYTVPSNARCKVHERMDACWAEADGGGKGTGV
jgi:hypothetical protein